MAFGGLGALMPDKPTTMGLGVHNMGFGSALHSHCRGHRLESGMLHHKSCISMQDFLFISSNMKD